MHTHQFIRIDEARKFDNKVPVSPRMDGSVILGATAGCIECGEVRTVWADGSIVTHNKAAHDATSTSRDQ